MSGAGGQNISTENTAALRVRPGRFCHDACCSDFALLLAASLCNSLTPFITAT
jgi:hypothetical protein